MQFLADVCIPTMNEKGYIERTLSNLTQQTLYKRGNIHIVAADYKDSLNAEDKFLEELCKKFKYITYLPVFRKGIGYARNMAVSAALSDIFVSFDADSIYNRPDALELMIAPILRKEAQLTNCETMLVDFNTGQVKTRPSNIYEFASNLGTALERFILARGPSLTVSREAYTRVGGFRDVDAGEDYYMAIDVCLEFSIRAKKFIEDVKVLTSDRRAKGWDKHGLSAMDYSKIIYR